jgi:hypothetical protein
MEEPNSAAVSLPSIGVAKLPRPTAFPATARGNAPRREGTTKMRMNRLALALVPVVLIACGDDGTTESSGAGSGGLATGGQAPGTGGVVLPTGGMSSGGTGATSTGGSTSGATGGLPTGGAMVGGTGGAPVGGSGGTPTGGAPTGGGAAGGTGGIGASGAGGTGGAGAGGASGGIGGTGGSGAGGAVGGTGGLDASGGVGADGGTGGTGGGVISICPYTPPQDPNPFPQGWTSGEVTVFNDNGGWTWYNDERVVVDPDAGKIIVSSAESSASSQTASPNIDVVIHDLATGANDRTRMGSLSYSDDHNNGGIVVLGPGEYYVAWAHHNRDCVTHWRNYEGGAWGGEQTHNWSGQGCPWGQSQSHVTYNNPWKIDGRYYNFIRSVDTSPNFLVSDDGKAWTFGGRLTASPQQGYNAGYYKYWGNNVDRVDFFATEAHPRDADTSVYHGYVQGGRTYDSLGAQKDDTINDTNAPGITEYTKVFSAGGTINGVTLHNLWNFDIARYEDGTIGVLWQGREVQCPDKNNCDPKHHVLYSRFDGAGWTSTYLVKGGRTLYRDRSDWWEEDYLGGAALDPDDPHVIYVSTNIDPRDNSTTYPVNEIWKGVTCDEGASFEWEPVTMNSPNENLRPVVPKWDAQNTALVWFRGNYQTAQMYSAEVVGVITRE